MKNITIEIGSNLFDGFYESIHCNSDEFIDIEMEDKAILDDLLFFIDNKDDIEVVYEYEDINEYEKDVCDIFMQLYVERIIDELPIDITDKECFKLDIVGDIEVVSPPYYNFTTDKCYINVETNYNTLNMIKEYTLSQKGANRYILDHFTSCDGFISFISNDINIWRQTDIKDYEEREIIALLDMLLILANEENGNDLNEYTFYDTDKYCYVIPYCYIKSKKYDMYEYVNKVIKAIKSKYPIALQFDIYPF